MNSIWIWVKACRPKTLIASIAPIIVGAENFFVNSELNNPSIIVLLGCFFFVALIQIATNLANDYFDSKRGADLFRENAPERYVSSGKLDKKKVLAAVFMLLILSFCVGLFTLIFSNVSFWFVPFGLICISLSILYTGGPYPLAYNGLGDIFVILFFGLIAVEGTTFFLSSANAVPYQSNLISAFAIGFLINNLLVVNNYRDYENDSKVGKNTSIVKFGKKFGILLFITGFVFPVYYGLISHKPAVSFVFITSVLSLIFLMQCKEIKYANRALSFSAISVLIYCICFPW